MHELFVKFLYCFSFLDMKARHGPRYTPDPGILRKPPSASTYLGKNALEGVI